MHTDLITIEPQVIQFNRQTTQTIKITNSTSSCLNNFFFCLYNVEKFSFKPETFSLAPNEHKLIEVTLKIKSTKSIAKEFAYLKSTEINKRLTLLINNFQSPESRTKQTEEGYSDMNTLSSRDYHELHNRALNKIINQQQKYIGKNNSASGVKQFNKTQNYSMGSSQKKYTQQTDYIKELEDKNMFLQKQVEQVNDILRQRQFQLQKVAHDNQFLSDQGAKFLKKISDKQNNIKQLSSLYEKIVLQNENYAKTNRQLQQRLELEKKQQAINEKQRQLKKQTQGDLSINNLYKNYESRIKQLENIVESSQRQNITKFNKEFKKQVQKKDKQLEEIRRSLEHHQLLVRQHQINVLKLESQKKSIQENRKKLQVSNQQMQHLNNNLRQEIFVYKSKVQDNSNSKVQQYLEIALQSYKNENQNLKKSKFQLQKSLESVMNTSRQNQNEKKNFQARISSLNQQISGISAQLLIQQTLNQHLKDQHHLKIRQMTQNNVALLQKIAEQNNTKRQQQVSRLKKQIYERQKELQTIKQQMNLSTERQLEKIKDLEDQNAKLQEKVKKYKKETKKQLKSINDNAFDELKRIHEEKKSLQKKVFKLQKTVSELSQTSHNLENGRKRMKANQNMQNSQNIKISDNITMKNQAKSQFNQEDQEDNGQIFNETNIRSKSQYETTNYRKVGIHNQRHQLRQSRSISSKNLYPAQRNWISPSGANNYQLFELKEFVNFFHNQQQRFQYMFNLQSELNDPLDHNGRPLQNIKPLYKAIKFFKVVEHKVKFLQQKADQSTLLIRQNQFMRQKVSDSQKNDNKKDLSSLTINNQKLQDGPSFLVNKSNLGNMTSFEMIEFMKEQMKKQYNKQSESIRFIENKYEILKKKIYREYRTRIVELINETYASNKRQKMANVISKMELLIQRFIEGLSNLTHKEAVLNKEIRIKNNFKQQNGRLKQKINQIEHLLAQKHQGYCNRDPVKVFNCSTYLNNPSFKEQEWMQAIRLSAQLLTQKAQTDRLKEQLQIVRQDYNDLTEELNQITAKNQTKDSEIIKLKKNQLQLQKDYEKQLEKQNQILEGTKNKLMSGGMKNKGKTVVKLEERLKQKQKQIDSLKSQVQRKNVQLKNFKQKQKKWEQYVLETNRLEQKQKNLSSSYRRIEESNSMIKQSNRELRQQNNELKQIVDRLEKQLQRKKLYIKNIKCEEDDTRITKPLRVQQSLQQIKELQQAVKSAKQEVFRIKKQKDKQILKLESELNSAKNQALIHIKSLESVVRATIETIRKIFTSFKILIKRKGLSASFKQSEIIVPQNLIQINAAQIYQQFQEIMKVLDD